MLYIFDLIGIAVFAVSGTLAGMAARLDLLGVLVLAAVTAIGGGTMRDVLLNRHPIFWIKDAAPIYTIMAATFFTLAWSQFLPIPTNALLIADALGLAVFAISGAQIAEKVGCGPLVVIFMGTMTGAGGGVIRDILSAQVPLILRQDIYASAAILGVAFYLILRAAKVPTGYAFAGGLVAVAGIRLTAIAYGLQLPVFQLPQ